MQINKNRAGEPFTLVAWNEEQYRFVLSNWIEGEHITHCTEAIAKPLERNQERFMTYLAHFKARFFKRNHIWMGMPSLFIC